MTIRFEYPFQSHYATVDSVRLHYLDEGQGPVIWLMHGNTSWSYLYRKMIPVLVKAGYRCFVPDLMGFGMSDKPEDESATTVSSGRTRTTMGWHPMWLNNSTGMPINPWPK